MTKLTCAAALLSLLGWAALLGVALSGALGPLPCAPGVGPSSGACAAFFPPATLP